MLLGFVATVIGVALGMVLAVVILCMLLLNKKILGWYLSYANRITNMMLTEMVVDKEDEAL